jgi:hypothetical protein
MLLRLIEWDDLVRDLCKMQLELVRRKIRRPHVELTQGQVSDLEYATYNFHDCKAFSVEVSHSNLSLVTVAQALDGAADKFLEQLNSRDPYVLLLYTPLEFGVSEYGGVLCFEFRTRIHTCPRDLGAG